MISHCVVLVGGGTYFLSNCNVCLRELEVFPLHIEKDGAGKQCCSAVSRAGSEPQLCLRAAAA